MPENENAAEQLELGNSEEDFEDFVRQLLEEEPEEETEEAPETPAAETNEPETPPTDNLKWEWDDGLQLDREQARNLALFDAWLTANPQLAQQIAGVAQGQYELVPKDGRGVQPDGPSTIVPPAAPASSTPPDELDLDDPVQKRLWHELNTTREQLNAASEVLTRHEQQIAQTGANTTKALVDRVATEFATKKELTADELTSVRKHAAYLLPQFSAPTDMETGLPRQVDPVYAVEQALEAAYWSIPQFRTKALENLTQQKVEDLRKKSKLNSLGGTSGSVPRKAQKPSNDTERRDAMIAEVAAAWNGNGN